MMKMFQTMQSEIKNLKHELEKSSPQNAKDKNKRRGRNQNRKTPDEPDFQRRTTDKYCWTHGGCAHTSADCKAKAPGHQNSATFSNKQGGSKGFCS